MADRVRGITIELNGDVTPLNKALSGANKEIKTTQTALKDVEKLLKLDPKNVELLTQKQKLLGQAVEEVKKKLDTLKQAEAQAQEQFAQGKISQEQYDALQREIIATEQELSRLEKAANESNAKLAHVGAVAQEISEKTGEWAEKTRGLSIAAGGVVTALGGMALSAVTSADNLETMAQQTGFSVEELQKFQYAAELVDVSLDDITSAAARLKRNMTSSSSGVVDAFNKLGVSVRNADGSLRSSKAVFNDVIKALSQVENETEKDTLAMQLLGKGADSLAGIIDDGGAALKRYGDEAESMGLILSQKTVGGLSDVNDKLEGLKSRIQGVIAVNGAKVIEAFLPLIESAANFVGGLAEKFGALDEGQLKTIATIATLIAGISPALTLISKVSGAISVLTPLVSTLNAVMAANPVGAIAAAAGILLTTILSISAAMDTSKSDYESLTTAAENLSKATETANKAYETQAKDIETTYQKAQPYLKRLEELEKQGDLTAGEQWEYTKAVERLHELYPDLNLDIDENTGKLKDNIYNIEAQTKALKDQAIQRALMEKFNFMLEAMADAQVEVYENELKLKDAREVLTDREAKEAAALDKVREAEENLAWARENDATKVQEYQFALDEAVAKYEDARLATEQAREEVNELTEAVNTGKEKVAEYAADYDRAVSGIAEIMSSEGESAGSAFMEGMARGIANKLPTVQRQAGSAARSVSGQAKSELRIASPSKVAEEIGRFWDEGLVIGMKKGQADIEDTSAEVAETMIPVQNTTTNNTTTHNVGGITVNVSAAPGQDVQAIAEAVMDEIQAAVEREGAAL